MDKGTQLLNNRMPAPRNGGFKMKDYWIWCGSVIKADDGKYHMFASRWSKQLPMHPGWLTNSEVVRAVSDTPEGPYSFVEVVLPARGPQYWDGRSTHNPMIFKYEDKYILYYMGTTHPFPDVELNEKITVEDKRIVVSRTNKRIGIAISNSIYGPWERLNHPIMNTRADKFDNLLVSNPTPWIHENGSVTMVYKSRNYLEKPQDGFYHGPMKLGVAKAIKYDQIHKPIVDNPILNLGNKIIEDPFIWKEQDGFHLIAKDMSGSICGEQNGGMYAFSEDAINWDVKLDVKSYSRRIKWDDGSEEVMGQLERPFILFEQGKPTHMFFAVANGPGGFENATDTWNMVVPLKN